MKQSRVAYHYSPMEGSFRRGYTRHTDGGPEALRHHESVLDV
jgi:hypothetical protein